MIIENKQIVLNSLYGIKQNGTLNSNVLFNFKGILTDEPDIIRSNICVMNAQIPVSFYTITEVCTISAYAGLSGQGIATIPPGNYNFNSLKTVIDDGFALFNVFLRLTIDKTTGKLTLFQYNLSVIDNIIFSSASFAKILGWYSGVGPYASVANNWVAPYPMNLLGVKKLNIQSQKLQINSFNSATNTQTTILATIPVDAPAYSLILYNTQTDLNKSALQSRTIDQIDITITDEAGTLIDFNGVDWTLTLVLESFRYVPEKPTPSFRQLVQPPEIVEDPADIKELELLSA